MSADRIVIVGCGAAKRPDPAPASSLYTGQHYRLAMAAALAIAPRDRVFILSAKYGLVTLDQTISPYDLTIGDPGAVTGDEVALQAASLGVLGCRVVVLASVRYADIARIAWGERFVTAPLAGQGIGRQRGTLARIRTEGLPA